jgi:hypothetical protein
MGTAKRAKELINTIFKSGGVSLYADGRAMILRLRIPSKDFNGEDFKRAVDSLLEFRDYLVSLVHEGISEEQERVRWKVAVAYAMPVIFSLACIIGGLYINIKNRADYPPFDNMDFFIRSIIIFLPFGAGYLVIAFKLLKGFSNVSKRFTICLTVTLIWMLCSFVLIMNLNGALDNSEPKRLLYRAVYKKKGKGQSYLVFLQELSQDPKYGYHKGKIPGMDMTVSRNISVKYQDFKAIKENQTLIEVFIKDGFFGINWLYSYHLVEYKK